ESLNGARVEACALGSAPEPHLHENPALRTRREGARNRSQRGFRRKRVEQVEAPRRQRRLVRLQRTDEMPAQVVASDRTHLLQSALQVVLAEVVLAGIGRGTDRIDVRIL